MALCCEPESADAGAESPMTATNPQCEDQASEAITVVMNVVRLVFDPDAECPPIGGGSKDVRFFTWAGAPLAAWDAHTVNGENCAQPFLWVRLDMRYRTLSFPEETPNVGNCSGQPVIVLEIGVGRCSTMEAETDWATIAREAEVSLDDSWRIEKIMCAATNRLVDKGFQVSAESIIPYGPEGGVSAWSGMIRVGF